MGCRRTHWGCMCAYSQGRLKGLPHECVLCSWLFTGCGVIVPVQERVYYNFPLDNSPRTILPPAFGRTFPRPIPPTIISTHTYTDIHTPTYTSVCIYASILCMYAYIHICISMPKCVNIYDCI